MRFARKKKKKVEKGLKKTKPPGALGL